MTANGCNQADVPERDSGRPNFAPLLPTGSSSAGRLLSRAERLGAELTRHAAAIEVLMLPSRGDVVRTLNVLEEAAVFAELLDQRTAVCAQLGKVLRQIEPALALVDGLFAGKELPSWR